MQIKADFDDWPLGGTHVGKVRRSEEQHRQNRRGTHSPQKADWILGLNLTRALLTEKYQQYPKTLNKTQIIVTQYSKCPGYNLKSFNMKKNKQQKKKPTHIRKDNKGEMKTFSSEGNL